MKSRDGKSQRREEKKKKKEDQERESLRRKKIQAREKVGKLRNSVFFQWFVGLEGPKVGSLKRRVRGHLATWEMTSCTLSWREAHFQVKMYKTHHVQSTFGSWDVQKCTPLRREAHFEVKSAKNWRVQSTFGSWDVEKVHAVVAQSRFPSQNVQNTPRADHFWKLRCWKSARHCGAKHISKSKCTKHTTCRALLEVEMLKKCTPLWREAHFEVKRQNFWMFRCRFAWQAPGLCTLSKVSKTWGFCSSFKRDGRRGALEEDLERWISRDRRGIRDMC